MWRSIEKVQLTVTVHMLQFHLSKLSQNKLYIGNRNENTRCLKLSTDSCTIINSQNILSNNIFPIVHTKYKNIELLAERTILAAKNVDVNGLNWMMQQLQNYWKTLSNSKFWIKLKFECQLNSNALNFQLDWKRGMAKRCLLVV